MKQGKTKILALTMALIIGSVAILTCSMYALAELPVEETSYDRNDFVDESLLVSDEVPEGSDNTDDNPPAAADPGDFSVQVSLHTYKTGNIALVEVKNQGEANSRVTVTGSYLDENGDVIGTESKSFDGFEPGLVNNFIFNPGYAFADFAYTVAAEETEKTPYASQIEVYGWKGGWLTDTQGNMFYREAPLNAHDYEWDPVTFEPIMETETVTVCIDLVHANHAKEDIYVAYDWLVLDAKGDVFYAESWERDMNAETPAGMKDYSSRPIYTIRTNTEEFKTNKAADGYFRPAALMDGFTVVVALTDVTPCEDIETVWVLSELLDFFVGELGYDYDYIVNWAIEEAEWRGIQLIIDVEL